MHPLFLLSFLCLLTFGGVTSHIQFQPHSVFNNMKLERFFDKGVQRMEINAKDVFSSLLGQKIPQYMKDVFGINKLDGSKMLGDGFKWSPCRTTKQPITIKRLSLKPSPLYFPGTIDIDFEVLFSKAIEQHAVLNAMVDLEIFYEKQWLKVPCAGFLGSCNYTNLCDMSQQIEQCPKEFDTANIPCKCPFPKGDYKLNNLSVEIDAPTFLTGKYKANVVLADKNQSQLACYNIFFTIG